MESFYLLPNELLIHIISTLTTSKSALFSLSLCNHHLSTLCALPLYHSIIFSQPSGDFHTPARCAQNQFPKSRTDQFIRTITSKPPIKTIIHSLHIIWTRSNADPLINDMVSKLPHLQTLQLECHQGPHQHFLFDSMFSNELKSLTRFTLKLARFEKEMFFVFLALPSLRELKVESFVDDLRVGDDLSKARIMGGESRVKRLEFGKKTAVGMEMLESLIGRMKELERLEIPLPARSRALGREKRVLLVPLNPWGIGELICQEVGECLRELRIGDEGLTWSVHSGSRIDLRGMKRLERLCVPAALFFVDLVPAEGRKEVWKYLPGSLRCLEILFTNNFSIISPRPHPLHAPLLPCHHSNNQLSWLSELAIHKSTTFPYLSQIILRETVKEDPVWRRKTERPPILGKLDLSGVGKERRKGRGFERSFKERGIELEIWVRMKGSRWGRRRRDFWDLRDLKEWLWLERGDYDDDDSGNESDDTIKAT